MNGRRRSNPFLGIVAGFLAAAITSAVAALEYIVSGPGVFTSHGLSFLSAIAIYWAGGIVGGLLFGLLLPIATWRWGAAVLGMISMTPLFVLDSLTIGAFDLFSVLFCAAVIGGGAGYALWDPPRNGKERSQRHE